LGLGKISEKGRGGGVTVYARIVCMHVAAATSRFVSAIINRRTT